LQLLCIPSTFSHHEIKPRVMRVALGIVGARNALRRDRNLVI
jgi:hypothetical protein